MYGNPRQSLSQHLMRDRGDALIRHIPRVRHSLQGCFNHGSKYYPRANCIDTNIKLLLSLGSYSAEKVPSSEFRSCIGGAVVIVYVASE